MDDGRIGSEIAGYRVLEQIGHGGTSVVYLAEHVRLGRKAALKLLAPAFGEADFSDRFVRESQLAAVARPPRIVPVYDAGEEDGAALHRDGATSTGSDLARCSARRGRCRCAARCAILGQVAAALDAAHARGLVHRDVKPANILVGADDRAFLSDFGAVKELAAAGMTRTGSFVGTIEYGAPEQIEGRDARRAHRRLRPRVRALRVPRRRRRRSIATSEVAVLNAHLHAPPPQLHKAQPELPAGARRGGREGALQVAARPLRDLRRAGRRGARGGRRLRSRRRLVPSSDCSGSRSRRRGRTEPHRVPDSASSSATTRARPRTSDDRRPLDRC